MDPLCQTILDDPRFHAVERRRARLRATLALIVGANVTWYIAATACYPVFGFARAWGEPVMSGGTLTWGIAIGLAQVVLFVVLVAFYVHRANGEFEREIERIVAAAREQVAGA
ncbi:MAG: DUF485 domain-containing protein [Gammaproteobacteria bacterium]